MIDIDYPCLGGMISDCHSEAEMEAVGLTSPLLLHPPPLLLCSNITDPFYNQSILIIVIS